MMPACGAVTTVSASAFFATATVRLDRLQARIRHLVAVLTAVECVLTK